jgi:hypothetical protein
VSGFIAVKDDSIVKQFRTFIRNCFCPQYVHTMGDMQEMRLSQGLCSLWAYVDSEMAKKCLQYLHVFHAFSSSSFWRGEQVGVVEFT